MTTSTTKTKARNAYLAGVRDGTPFMFVVVPFSVLFGVVATDAGLSLAQAMSFTVLVIAGAAQFAALQMMVENAALPLVLLAALAVNLRMAMYSASLVPYLGAAPMWQRALVSYLNFDQTYLTSITRYENSPEMTVPERVMYFMGVATPIVPLWYSMTLVGIFAGASIPDAWALDFILPITFLAMVAPMLKSLAHLAAAAVSVVVALLLINLPSGMGLLIAAGAAMVTGTLVETWLEQRK
ncbi:AzlC family ABC transporter permease [Yoonia sediminilitoris]|uniref:Putative branched-subunit amino acid permease n=1 Tax=Yoonia sediminilitoris TaxID=1286148 RepID=A0A2T6KID0_9RHOB|nr:AzlC family ABC transporter permease [Yoonia sediminilitoris]PUB15486.1 putative branched-subunit amino acid permease [Yoonia sediminilitoris]RCW96096.1 putative branched-subunit amino acid permease [Yoonia sediminilitoris]